MSWHPRDLFSSKSASRPRGTFGRPQRPTLEALEDRLAPATLPAGFTEAPVASGLVNASAMEFSPTGLLFVAEQGGAMKVFNNGVQQQANFFQNTPLKVDAAGERGLLGVAFDPNFAGNHYVYVYYTATTPAVHNRISRFTANANGDLALAGSETVLLDLPNLGATNHNGGAIHFGPDGNLYAGVGENANSANAQTLGNLLGKILRINSDGTIPTDNPFYARITDNNRAIWALEAVMNSVRNSLGMRKTRDHRGPIQPENPHCNAVFTQVHNTL
jgi:glucose/arabinose dehydrogenase